MKRILLGKNSYNPLSSYPHETTNESSYSLKYSHYKNLINEYILSHLFPHNAKIQVNTVDVRVIKV